VASGETLWLAQHRDDQAETFLLAALRGSGPGGAVLLADVEAALGAGTGTPGPPPPVSGTPDTGTPGTGIPDSGSPDSGQPAPEGAARVSAAAPTPTPAGKPGLDPAALRAAVARMMARSKREIPHYYLAQTIDLQPAADWLAARNARVPPDRRLLMGALIARATALAAADAPEMNGTHEGDRFTPAGTVNLGVIVALRGGGLIAPAILDAQTLDLPGIMEAMRDLVARARTGRLRNSEMTAGTLTLTSMGEGACEAVTGVIYPPQVAIVGAGAPVMRPWVLDGAVVPRLTLTLTLAADHRVSDGRRGARFLADIATRMTEPDSL
jgi:pyruvate dehydrogenase E2 component (dihydrolipoamide acetyltransferase)